MGFQSSACLVFALAELLNGFGLLIRDAGPLGVVLARDHASMFGNEDFSASPEVYGSEDRFEPAIGDAIVAIEGHLMVLAMNRRRKNQTGLLQYHREHGGFGHVRPRVELIGHRYEEGGPNPEVEGEDRPGLRNAVVILDVFEYHEEEDRQSSETIVSVGLEEIMITHGGRRHMMFTEGADESLADEGRIECTPGIRRPMQQAGTKVRK